jgi:hypothetical protein
MKRRDLRADLHFAVTTCNVTIVPHRTRLETRLTNTNQKRSPFPNRSIQATASEETKIKVTTQLSIQTRYAELFRRSNKRTKDPTWIIHCVFQRVCFV